MTTYELLQHIQQLSQGIAIGGSLWLMGKAVISSYEFLNARKNYAHVLAEKTQELRESVEYEKKVDNRDPITYRVSIERNREVSETDEKIGLVGFMSITPRMYAPKESYRYIPFDCSGNFPVDHSLTDLGIQKNNYRGISYYNVHDNKFGLLSDRAPFTVALSYSSALRKMQDRADEIANGIAKKLDINTEYRSVTWTKW